MIDTPRTDAISLITEYLEIGGFFNPEIVNVQQHEAVRDTLMQAREELRTANQRIKRLEEALDLVRPHCSFVHHSKKHQHAYDEPCPVVALIENAKEAKL